MLGDNCECNWSSEMTLRTVLKVWHNKEPLCSMAMSVTDRSIFEACTQWYGLYIYEEFMRVTMNNKYYIQYWT